MRVQRTEEFAKDRLYESLLEEANRAVEGWGEVEGEAPSRPILFIVGLPRSGTTLLYQLLAATGGFLYPNNLMARFYRAPAWGARMVRITEPLLPRGEMSYTSRAGNTDAWWGPHEFGYFWERHLEFREHHEPGGPPPASLARALAALEKEDPRPLLFKSAILSFVLPELARALPTARFLRIHRPLLPVAASIHRTRIRFHGNPRAWWSVRPADALDDDAPPRQIAHQLRRATEALDRARDGLQGRFGEIAYRELCRDPRGALKDAEELLGSSLDRSNLPDTFMPSGIDGDPALLQTLEEALREQGLDLDR